MSLGSFSSQSVSDVTDKHGICFCFISLEYVMDELSAGECSYRDKLLSRVSIDYSWLKLVSTGKGGLLVTGKKSAGVKKRSLENPGPPNKKVSGIPKGS